MLPDILRDSKEYPIGPNGYYVFSALVDLAKAGDQYDVEFEVPLKKLAAITGLSTAQLSKTLWKLADAKAITIRKRADPRTGSRLTSMVTLLDSVWERNEAWCQQRIADNTTSVRPSFRNERPSFKNVTLLEKSSSNSRKRNTRVSPKQRAQAIERLLTEMEQIWHVATGRPTPRRSQAHNGIIFKALNEYDHQPVLDGWRWAMTSDHKDAVAIRDGGHPIRDFFSKYDLPGYLDLGEAYRQPKTLPFPKAPGVA